VPFTGTSQTLLSSALKTLGFNEGSVGDLINLLGSRLAFAMPSGNFSQVPEEMTSDAFM